MSWSGSEFHCIKCGFLLIEEVPPEPELDCWDFDSSEQYVEYQQSDEYKYSVFYWNYFRESNTYHCSNSNCQCSKINSIILFHPLRNIGSSAGDSLAFGTNAIINDNIFCFSCGNKIDSDKMCCTNKKCFYQLDHCLDIIEDIKVKFGIGYIK